jgi:mycofactocin precursor
VNADNSDREEENVAVTDELMVEEVSIDGLCGVY